MVLRRAIHAAADRKISDILGGIRFNLSLRHEAAILVLADMRKGSSELAGRLENFLRLGGQTAPGRI